MSRHNYTPEQTIKAFWNKVNKNGSIPAHCPEFGQCWEWIASKNKWGYGNFKFNGKDQRANRVSWLINNGEIPDGLWVLHKCDNPSCVNPNHLFLGTHLDNMRDKVRKGRGNNIHGEHHPQHKLTDDDVKNIRDRYAMGGITYRELGVMFGVCGEHIGAIIRRVWRK